MDPTSTRGRLFAAIAHRLGSVTDGQLDMACQAQRRDPSRGLVDILLAHGAIDARNPLADDIDRFLADEPVAAWPDPWRVRAWRFAKRYRTAVAAAGVLLATTTVALAIGNVLVSKQRDRAVAASREAVDQRDLADRNAAMTREVIAGDQNGVTSDPQGEATAGQGGGACRSPRQLPP